MSTQRAFQKYAEERKKRNVIDHLLGDNRESIREQVLTERYTPNSDKNKDISNFLTRENADEEEARIRRLAEISENAKREMNTIGNKGQTTAPISLPENTTLKKNQIFGKESYEDFSKSQDEYMAKYNKDPLGKVAKAWGYLMDTPNRIPGINQIMDTAGKTFLGDENYEKHYTPSEYEKSTGNKVLDAGTKFAGNMVGLGMNPGQTLGLNSMLNVTDDLSKGIANKVTRNMTDKAGTRILNNTVRGVVDGASGDFINATRLGKSNEEILEDTLTGAVGGGVLFGGSKVFGESINALKSLNIPKLEVSSTPDIQVPNRVDNLKLPGDNLKIKPRNSFIEPSKVENQLVGPIKTEATIEPISDLKTTNLNTPIQENLLKPRANNIKQLDDKLKIKPKNSLVEPSKIESNNLLPSKIESDIEPISPIKNDVINPTQQIPKVITETVPKIETPKVTTRMIPKALRETVEAPKIENTIPKEQEALTRLKSALEKNKDFYERNPDLKEDIEIKIKALEEGKGEVVDVTDKLKEMIAFTGGKIGESQPLEALKSKKTVRDIGKSKNIMTMDKAKEVANSFKETKNTIPATPKFAETQKIETPIKVEETKVEEAPKTETKDLKTWIDEREKDLDEKKIRSAYRNISFDPERRATSEIKSYKNHFENLVNDLEPLAKTDEQKTLLTERLDKYQKEYLSKYNQILDVTSRTASPGITGGANFPAEKNRKLMERERKLYLELQEWNKKQINNMKKSLNDTIPTEVKIADEIRGMKAEIEEIGSIVKAIKKGESPYSKSSMTNSLAGKIRTLANNGKVDQVNEALKYVEEVQKKTGVPIFAKNNSIWKIGEEAKLKQTEALSTVGKEVETLKEYTGAKIVKNYQADRVQISFDEKPSREITEELSKNGWHFSKSNGDVWQRKLTSNAEYNAKNLIDKNFKEVEDKKVKPAEETAFTSEEAPARVRKVSKLKTNTWENTEYLQSDEAKQVVDDISGEYNVKINKDTMSNAAEELNRNYNGAVNRISTYGINTAEDTAIAGLVTKDLVDKGDYENLKTWLHGVRAEATNLGQSVQAFKTWKQGTTEGTLLKATREVNKAKEEIFKENPKLKGTIEAETKKIVNDLDKIDNDKAGELVGEIEVNTATKKPRTPGETKGTKETPIEKEPTWEEVNNSLADRLAKKVDNTLKDPIERAMDTEKELIDNLFKISKDYLPKKDVKTPTDKFELVKLALENKNQYHDVFKKAKEILTTKYGEGSEEVDLLQSWIDKKARPIFFEKNMDKVISNKLKEHGIKMTDLVKKHYSVNSNLRKDLIEELTGNGLSKEDSSTISSYINRRMKDLTKEAKEKVLNDMAKPKNNKPRVEKTTMERILELNNLGGYDNAKVRDIITEKYGLPSLTTENIKHIVNEMEKITKMDEGEAKEIAFAKVKAYISEQIPSTLKDKARTVQMVNMLMNTKTMGRNVKGNIVMAGLETIKDIPGAAIDKLISKSTGETTTLAPGLDTIKTKSSAFVKETKRTVTDFKEGIDRNPSAGQYDLPSTKAFKKIENPKGIKQRFNNVYSTAEDLTKLGLSIGDRGFYKSAYEDSIRTQKLTNPNKSLEEMQKEATRIAEDNTFQNESTVYKAMNNIKKGLNTFQYKDFGVGDIIIPFVKTPANIIDKAIDYTPLGGIRGVTNLAFNMKKGKITQKEVVDQLARATTGSALMGVGVLLSSQGLLTGKQDENSNVANFKKQAGITPYSIKIGDKYHTIDWVQPVAVPLMVGADIYQSLVKEKDSNITGSILEATKTGLSTVFNQSLLQGISKLFGGYSQNAGENLLDGVLTTLSQAPGQFVPFNSALKQVTQLTDNTYRDTSSDNPIKKEANKIAAKIPGLSKTLPARVDLLGREQKTYDSKNIVSRLNDVLQKGGFTNTYEPTKAEKTILEAYEKTGNTDLIPKKAPTKITEDKVPYNLSIEEQRRYQKTMGTEIQKNLSYKNSYSEEQIEEVIKEAKEKAREEYLKYKK